MLNEPICSDTHKLYNLRNPDEGLKNQNELRNKRYQNKYDIHCDTMAGVYQEHPNSIMEIFAYASFTITLWRVRNAVKIQVSGKFLTGAHSTL